MNLVKRTLNKILRKSFTQYNKIDFSKAPNLRRPQLELQLKQYIIENRIKNPKLEQFLQDNKDFTKKEFKKIFPNKLQSIEVLSMIQTLNALLPSNNMKQNLIICDYISEQILVNSDSFTLIELIEVGHFFAKNKIYHPDFIDHLSSQAYLSLKEILILHNKAWDGLKKLVYIYQEINRIDSELFERISQSVKLLYRENLITDKKLVDATRVFLKNGACYGLSGILQNKIELKKMDFNELVMFAEVIVPQKILTKKKQIYFEKIILQYLKFFMHEEYTLDILLHKKFDKNMKITIQDFVRLFKAFSTVQIFEKPLKDKLLSTMEKHLEGLKSKQFVQVIAAFSEGKYNSNNFKSFYDKLEILAMVKIFSMRSYDLILCFHHFCKYGKMSVVLLKEFSKAFRLIEIEKQTIVSLQKFLECLAMIRSYLLPEEIIEDQVWRENVDQIQENFTIVYKKVESILDLYFLQYKQQDFNYFLAPRLIELISINSIQFSDINNLKLFDIIESMIDYYQEDYRKYKSRNQLLLEDGLKVQQKNLIVQSQHAKKLDPNDITRIVYVGFKYNLPLMNQRMLIEFIVYNFLKIDKDKFCIIVQLAVLYEKDDIMDQIVQVFEELNKYGDIRALFHQKHFILLIHSLITQYSRQIVNEQYFNEQILQNSSIIEKDTFVNINSKKQQIEFNRLIFKIFQLEVQDIFETLLEINISFLDYVDFCYLQQSLIFLSTFMKKVFQKEYAKLYQKRFLNRQFIIHVQYIYVK